MVSLMKSLLCDIMQIRTKKNFFLNVGLKPELWVHIDYLYIHSLTLYWKLWPFYINIYHCNSFDLTGLSR